MTGPLDEPGGDASCRHDPRACDCGQMGGIEVIPLGILVFVVGALLIANAWAVVDAHIAASAAARAASHAASEAPDLERAVFSAEVEARLTAAGLGRDADRLDVEVFTDGQFERCTRVTVLVTTHVDAISLPWIGGFEERFEIESTSTAIVDPLREGLDGNADCVS